jgi:predicted O-linked N-acetylglucosamine transferase (SPINDLY family)
MNARLPAMDAEHNLALSGQMTIDQLFQACERMQAAQNADGAIALYRTWIAHGQSAHRHLALFNLGSLLQAVNDRDGAMQAYKECIALQPKLSQAHINLGLLYEKLGQHELALQQWAQVVGNALLSEGTDKAMQVVALNHIGRVHEDKKNYDLAEQALDQSLKLDPKQPGVIQHWVHIRQKACKWPVYKPLPNISHNDMLMATSPLAMLAMTDDPVQQLLTAYAFVERTYGFKQEYLSKGREYHHDRLRIGYVSGDLCVHAVGLLLPELLEGHDRTQFEIYGYDFSPEDGTAHRERLKNSFDHLRPIHSLSDRQVAELVLADEIDVLIDLHGLSAGARPGIFALHPAPKQGTYLGFIGTTGMPWFDFVIADKYVLPEELTPYFTEKPLYVDGCFLPLTRDETPVREATRAEFGLPEDAFVMAAFGNVYKITEEMFNVWLNILKEAPHSVLWLMDDNKATTFQLKTYARQKGADLSRIIFTGRAAHAEYLAKLRMADIFLDNFPYNCGSTTRDAANASLPLVTMHGKTMVSRMGLSIQKALGASNLIAETEQGYVKIVLDLSNDKENCRELKQAIKRNLEIYQATPVRMTYQLESQLTNLVSGRKSNSFGYN